MFPSDNRIHINYSREIASDGTVIRSSVMVNVYEQDVESAVKLFRELKEKLEDKPSDTSHQSIGDVLGFPSCPDHHIKMILRTRRDGTGYFFGCPKWNQGCKKILPYPISPKENIEMSSF